MKIKNILILGGIAFAIYYLTKKKSTPITATVTPDNADKDLTDVSNGDEPQSLSADDKLKLFKQANNYYRGGAPPSSKLLADLSEKRYRAELRLQELGLLEEFKKWKKIRDLEVKIQKLPPRKISTRPVGGLQAIPIPLRQKVYRPLDFGDIFPEGTPLEISREKMPIPRNRTYAVNTLGLANEPRMAI